MPLLDDIKKQFVLPFEKLREAPIAPVAPPVQLLQKPLPLTFSKLLPHISLDGTEGIINTLLSEALTQGKAAPNTHLDRDMVKIAAFMGVETGLAHLPGISQNAAFLLGGLFDKIAEVVLTPNYRDMEYQTNWSYPNRILGTETAIQAYFRSEITGEQLAEHLRKEGFNDEAQKTLLSVSRQILGIGELINLRHRGIIPDDADFTRRALMLGYSENESKNALDGSRPLTGVGEAIQFHRRDITPYEGGDAFTDLRKAGWTDERIKAITAASVTLPSVFEVQDFKVRQVDNPAVVDKFKLDAFIDEDYFTEAKKHGYDRKTAQRLYRFYWNMPSFFALRSMYSGGEIPEQDFRDMLAFMRFTPYWIDRLAQGLKPRLTSAEIKDQYKYKLIKGDEIAAKLTANGYAPHIAKELQQLWIADVKQTNAITKTADQEQEASIKGSTTSLIITAYKDKVINVDTAKQYLKTLGHDDIAVDLELKLADYALHQQFIKDEQTILEDNVLAGVMTINEALVKLSEAGVTADQLDLFSVRLNKATTHKPKTPTIAEAEAWFKKKIIDASQLSIILGLNGIGSVWMPYYLLHAGVAADVIQTLNL